MATATKAKRTVSDSDLKYLSQWRRSAHFIESGKNDARRGRMLRQGFIEVDPLLGSPWLRLSKSGQRLVREWKRSHPERTLDGSKQAAGGRSVGRKRAKPDDSTYLGRFAVRLNERMKRQRLSVKELADKLGVSETTVYDWLAARKEPNMDRYPALAQALGYKKPGDVLPLG